MGINTYDLWDIYYFFYQNSYSVDIWSTCQVDKGIFFMHN